MIVLAKTGMAEAKTFIVPKHLILTAQSKNTNPLMSGNVIAKVTANLYLN